MPIWQSSDIQYHNAYFTDRFISPQMNSTTAKWLQNTAWELRTDINKVDNANYSYAYLLLFIHTCIFLFGSWFNAYLCKLQNELPICEHLAGIFLNKTLFYSHDSH